jgi:DNA-binding transcriptional regulator YiaG
MGIATQLHSTNLDAWATPCHLAAKMGIATALVQSWEDGTSQPNERQLNVLTDILEFAPKI